MPECSFLYARLWPRPTASARRARRRAGRSPATQSQAPVNRDRQPPLTNSAARPLCRAKAADQAAEARSGAGVSQRGADRSGKDGFAAAKMGKFDGFYRSAASGWTSAGRRTSGLARDLAHERNNRIWGPSGAVIALHGHAWPPAGLISPNPPSTSLASASTAAWASGPLARKVSVVPFPAPSVNKSRMLLPLITSFPLTIST
jgi:hypothetical protein